MLVPKANRLIRLLLVTSVFFVLVQLVLATTTSINVSSGEEVTVPLDLAVDDRVVIKFTVVGGESGSTLDFYITYPNETVKAAFANVGNINYPFVCDKEGEYLLHFSNTASSENRFVTLDYEVQHYILGMPQMLFLAIIIVVVCVAAVAVFILMGKPR
jgi:hypothetical protein